jgi:CheY-like chemotaxis protein
MLVDDDDDARDLIASSLERHGYSTASARNGREALDQLASIQPDLILLDLQMPVMNGLEFRETQRRDRALIEIPTAVMSGSKLEAMLDPAIVATFRKPTRFEDLLALARMYCVRPQT